jgi:hypothetical protein
VKRRTSLDNSCLASNNTFRHLITIDSDTNTSRYPRRLSLNPGVTVTTSFLAGTEHRPKMELDSSDHEAVGHSRQYGRYSSNHRDSENSNETLVTMDTEKDQDEISLGSDSSSDCDSFCDASVQELPDKDYLRNNLGASCYWNSNDNLTASIEMKFDFDAIGEEEDDDFA